MPAADYGPGSPGFEIDRSQLLLTIRRVHIADEQKGLTVGFSMFYHRGIPKIMKIKTPSGEREVPNTWGVFNLPAMHIYKIKKGKIYEIEAIGFVLPYSINPDYS